MRVTILLLLPLLYIGCTKQTDNNQEHKSTISANRSEDALAPENSTHVPNALRRAATFTKYTIQKGAHSCDQSFPKLVSGTSMNFIAKFDETAIYPAVITDYNHALDVNKLYGFSEALDNQYNSARIGWRWYNNELQLFAYVYVNGTLLREPVSYDPPYIKSVAIGAEVNCSIAVSGGTYIFTVDGVVVTTARGETTSKYNGYQQYPYFGGTLTAPHLINIYIK